VAEGRLRCPSPIRPLGLQIGRGILAALVHHLVGDLLAFIEAAQARALDGADVDEDVLAAAIGLNETETLGGVEPFDGACSNDRILTSKRENKSDADGAIASNVPPPYRFPGPRSNRPARLVISSSAMP
jgi:hypothetical protein